MKNNRAFVITGSYTPRVHAPCAVIVCRNRKQAAAIVKMLGANTDPVEFVARVIASQQMGMPSLAPHGFAGMREDRKAECRKLARAFLGLNQGE